MEYVLGFHIYPRLRLALKGSIPLHLPTTGSCTAVGYLYISQLMGIRFWPCSRPCSDDDDPDGSSSSDIEQEAPRPGNLDHRGDTPQ